MDFLTTSPVKNDDPLSARADRGYPDPPATVTIADLGNYLHDHRLEIIHFFLNARRELVVEVISRPIISAEIPNPRKDPTQ